MGSMRVTKASAGATSQSRRDALKMFGRYAAAAPAAMVLLGPRESAAGVLKNRVVAKILASRQRGRGSHY